MKDGPCPKDSAANATEAVPVVSPSAAKDNVEGSGLGKQHWFFEQLLADFLANGFSLSGL